MTLLSVSTPHVWVMRPEVIAGVNTFPWKWGNWIRTPRIIPEHAERVPGAMGSASFRLLREMRIDPTRRNAGHPGYRRIDSFVVERAWIAITAGPGVDDGALDPAAVIWWGFVDRVDAKTVAGSRDTIGTVTAREAGTLLDEIQPQGWSQAAATSGVEPLDSPPSANYEAAGGTVIGNAVSVVEDGQGVYAFARDPSDCGTDASKVFTRWRLLRHAIVLCSPEALPLLLLECVDGSDGEDPSTGIAGYLNTADSPEVFDLCRTPTFKGVIDLLVPAARSVGWQLKIGIAAWTVLIHSLAETAAFGLPVAIPFPVDGRDLALAAPPHVTSTATAFADEVIVEGGRILFGFSIDSDGFEEDWTPEQQTAYENADPVERTKPQHDGVFSRFRFFTDMNRRGLPGESGDPQPICPEISWDGETASVDYGTSRAPNVPTSTLSRQVPWPKGLPTLDDDERDDRSKANPVWLTPRVFRVIDDDPRPWLDLTGQGGQDDLPISHLAVDVGDVGMTVTVRAEPAHLIGKDTFSDTVNPGRAGVPVVDYRDLVLTLGIWSDQRLRVSKRRTGVPDNRVLRRVRVQVDRFQCWVMTQGAVLGINDDFTPDRVPLDTFIRDDWAAAERFANELATYHFRSRRCLVAVLADPDHLPEWADLGAMIGSYTEGALDDDGDTVLPTEINTVVSSVAYDWSDAQVRVTVTTDLPGAPDAPAGGAGGGPSPSSGGPVSVAAGGTVAQVAARAAAKADQLDRDLQRVPLVVPFPPAYQDLRLEVIDGNLIDATTTTYGVLKTFVVLDSVPVAYDPNGVGTTPGDFSAIDGIGRAKLYVNNVPQDDLVLVCLDGRSPAQIPTLIGHGVESCKALGGLTLPVDGGGTVVVYVASWL